MNIFIYYFRLAFGAFILAVACIYFGMHDVKVGLLTGVTGLILLIPAYRMRFSHSPLLPAASFREYFNLKSILANLRWFYGLAFCLGGLGSFNDKDDNMPSFALLSFGIILISPLDDFIFEFKPVDKSSPPGPILVRNLGVFIYFMSICFYSSKDYLTGNILLGIGLFFLLINPVIYYLKNRKLPIVPVQELSAFKPGSGIKKQNKIPVQPIVETAPAADPPPLANPQEKIHPMKDDNDVTKLRERFIELSEMKDPHQRGYAFQNFLNELFDSQGLNPNEAYRLIGEEIDGSFELDSQIYLLEAKWHAKRTGNKELFAFHGKVEGKASWTRGLFISYNGFTGEAIESFGLGKRTSIIGMDGEDILCVLEGKISLKDLINKKIRKSGETNRFFVPVEELI